jgi:hypothetical protein
MAVAIGACRIKLDTKPSDRTMRGTGHRLPQTAKTAISNQSSEGVGGCGARGEMTGLGGVSTTSSPSLG